MLKIVCLPSREVTQKSGKESKSRKATFGWNWKVAEAPLWERPPGGATESAQQAAEAAAPYRGTVPPGKGLAAKVLPSREHPRTHNSWEFPL